MPNRINRRTSNTELRPHHFVGGFEDFEAAEAEERRRHPQHHAALLLARVAATDNTNRQVSPSVQQRPRFSSSSRIETNSATPSRFSLKMRTTACSAASPVVELVP